MTTKPLDPLDNGLLGLPIDDYTAAYSGEPYIFDGTMFPDNNDYTFGNPVDDFLSVSIPQSSPSSGAQTSPVTADISEQESSTSPLLDGIDLSLLEDWPSDAAAKTIDPVQTFDPSMDSSKRTRDNNDNDDLHACWKSSLCPSKKADGSKPEVCNGGCMPLLFEKLPPLDETSGQIIKSEPKSSIETFSTSTSSRKHKRGIDQPPPRRSSRTSSRSESDPSEEPAQRTILPKSKGRVPHNEVEKKYRENVNSQLEALRRVVPAQNALGGFDRVDIEDLPARQPSKAAIMSSATAYIKQLKRENRKMEDELRELRQKNEALQNLAKCDDCSLMKYIMRLKLQGPA